jgi:hypothetical protein
VGVEQHFALSSQHSALRDSCNCESPLPTIYD